MKTLLYWLIAGLLVFGLSLEPMPPGEKQDTVRYMCVGMDGMAGCYMEFDWGEIDIGPAIVLHGIKDLRLKWEDLGWIRRV
jgi:hypothetical protein